MATIILLCCAYILGLLVPLPWGNVGLASLFLGAALLRSRRWQLPLPQQWWYSPTSRWWIAAALVSGFAALYFVIRVPTPGLNDVSRLIPLDQASLAAQVTGTIERRPALTRRGSVQLWLKTQQAQLDQSPLQPVAGNLYVTVPRKAAKQLYPTQTITVTGQLYRPAPVTRPHGFDFAVFLAREGAFAGLKGTQVTIQAPGSVWGGWAIRQRIVQALVQGTDTRTGALIGALVLGKDAADIAYDLKDDFIQSGLAHALAASGFQVSLILAAVLTLGRSLSTSRQIAIGLTALLGYGLLSGAEPSIVRAILMGCACLAALGLKRQTRPVGLLLVVATLMLIWNPLWAFDLGFLLSMLATLGLLVTVQPLTDRLDWLPPTVASLLAVPLAATIWTLPLQLYTFGVLPLYSLLANVLTALLLSALTIGGFAASWGTLVWPPLGSGVAWLLFWPTQLLMAIVSGISQLPGHSLALGTISLMQLLALYGCIGAVWLWGQTRWKLMAILGFLILVVPLWQVQTQRFLVTVFDQTRSPMMVIQHPRSTVVLNSGDRLTATQSLVPFLQQEGINRIDWAIATVTDSDDQFGWAALLRRMTITTLSRCISRAHLVESSSRRPQREINVNPQENLSLGEIKMVLWRSQPTILELQIGPQRWLLVNGSNETDFSAWLSTVQLKPPQVLWWTGPLSASIIQLLHPQVVIATGQQVTETAIAEVENLGPKVFWTERDGTLQWSPNQGFTVTVNPGENNLSSL
jgi:competence protein ComEC